MNRWILFINFTFLSSEYIIHVRHGSKSKRRKGLRKEKLPSWLCPSHLPRPRRDNQSILPYLPPRDSLCTCKDTPIRMLNWNKIKPKCNRNTKQTGQLRRSTLPSFLAVKSLAHCLFLAVGSGGADGDQARLSGAASLIFTRFDLSGLLSADILRLLQAKLQINGAEISLP